jgi:transcriptional regulator with XRE-family HTH domain
MPTRERLAYLGLRRGQRLVRDFAEEVRAARLAAGLSQRVTASAAGLSKSAISRIERGLPPLPDLVTAARVAQAVGLDLTVRCYPAGGVLRDAAHVALLQRFLANVAASVVRTLEAPIRRENDQRAWDVLLRVGDVRIGVAAETRIRDLQALIRREQAKARDDGVDILILQVSQTRANRRALAEAGPMLRADFPMDTRAVLKCLRHGEAPIANGIVLA